MLSLAFNNEITAFERDKERKKERKKNNK